MSEQSCVPECALNVLTARQRAVLVARLSGETFAAIAVRLGIARQGVFFHEQAAILRLSRLAGRADVGVSCTDVLRSYREDRRGRLDDVGHKADRPRPMPRWVRAQEALDALADEFLADPCPDRAAYEQRGRELERAALCV